MKAICDQASGELYSNNFTKPLPAIGLYIAAASLACFLFLALDILTSFRDMIYWIKCKSFKLNALNLTLLSIATKLPADLNAPMPGPQHQLTKVSGVVFLCVSMGFFFPSLGTMDAPERLSNMVALAILVVTVAADIGIQIGTGAIFTFIPEHILLLCMMLLIMLNMVLAGLSTQILKLGASESESASKEKVCSSVLGHVGLLPQQRFDSYKRILPQVWRIASTNNPQCAMNREPHSCAAGFLSILSAVILVELEVRYLLLPSPGTNFPGLFCKGDSDYGWSIRVILISQTLVALLASLAISFRLFHGIDFRDPPKYFSNVFGFHEDRLCIYIIISCAPYVFWKLSNVAAVCRWASKSPRNFAIALVWLMVQVIKIINHSICFTVSIVPFLFGLLLSHYFSRTNRNQGGTISSPSSEEGTRKPGSWFCCNIEEVVETWIQEGQARPTTHLVQLLTRYNGRVDYTDWSKEPMRRLFQRHVNELHGSCYLFLAAIAHFSRSLYISTNSSEARNLATAVKEAEKLLLFVDNWMLPKHNDREVGRTAGKLIWNSMNSSSYAQANAERMNNENFRNPLVKASLELEDTIDVVSAQLSSMRDELSSSVFSHQANPVWDGIRKNIPMGQPSEWQGERNMDQPLEWLGERTMNIIVYCLSVILDEISPDKTYIMKLQMEDVREVAQVLGMIEALKQPLFPIFKEIYSHPCGPFRKSPPMLGVTQSFMSRE